MMGSGGKRKGSGRKSAQKGSLTNTAVKRVPIWMSKATHDGALARLPHLEASASRDSGFALTLSEQALWRGLILRGLDHPMSSSCMDRSRVQVRVSLTHEQYAKLAAKAKSRPARSLRASLAVEMAIGGLNPGPVAVASPPADTLSVQLPTVVLHRGNEIRRGIERGLVTMTRFGFRLGAHAYWTGQLRRALTTAAEVTMHGEFPEVPGRVRQVLTKIAIHEGWQKEVYHFSSTWKRSFDETIRRLLWASMRPRP